MACMHNAQTKANKQASTLSLKSLDHFGLNNEADCLTFPASYSAPCGQSGVEHVGVLPTYVFYRCTNLIQTYGYDF